MNKFIKPIAFTMAFTIPAIASAHVELSKVTENEVLITYNADDAATSLGRIQLERQIRRAAEKVCGSRRDLRRAGSIRQLVENRSCYEKAVADALSSIKAAG